MFHELMLLLAQRTLLLMISRVGADEIRINVIPQRLKSTNTDQNDALLTPLSISGTPKELDEALPAQLLESRRSASRAFYHTQDREGTNGRRGEDCQRSGAEKHVWKGGYQPR